MSESKHTPGKADAQSWMGSKDDPRWTVTLNGAVRFITAGDNDENNAKEAKRRWNNHDALLEACKYSRNLLGNGVGQSTHALAVLEAAIENAEKED